jgi:hypothetical protein
MAEVEEQGLLPAPEEEVEQAWRPRLLAALRAVPQSPYVWANVVYVVR